MSGCFSFVYPIHTHILHRQHPHNLATSPTHFIYTPLLYLHTLPSHFTNDIHIIYSPILPHSPTYFTHTLHQQHPYNFPSHTNQLYPHTLPSHFTYPHTLHAHTLTAPHNLPSHFTHIFYPHFTNNTHIKYSHFTRTHPHTLPT